MWTRDQVLAASHAWQWVPPGAQELRIEGIVVIDYPEWARMGFYAMPAHVADPARAVVAVCEAARSRGRTTSEWWITPSTWPPTLETLLVERGAVGSDVADILAYDMSGGVPAVPVADDVRSTVVTDATSLDDAEAVASAVWGGEPSSGARREQQLASLGDPLDDQGGFRVVAYAGRTAFATLVARWWTWSPGCTADVSSLSCAGTAGIARLFASGSGSPMTTAPDWRWSMPRSTRRNRS
jgi:hypothetical protein